MVRVAPDIAQCARMKTIVTFRPYSGMDREACIDLFNANCPEFFAANEHTD
jgi:hypothetical protein